MSEKAKDKTAPHPAISKWELIPCALCITLSLMYGVYNMAEVSSKIRQKYTAIKWLNLQYYFQPGIFFTSLRDDSDYEWQALETVTLWQHIPYLLLNAAATWAFKATHCLEYRRWSAFIVGVVFLVDCTSLYNTWLIFFMTLLAFVGTKFVHPIGVPWLLCAVSLWWRLPHFRRTDLGPFAGTFAYWHITWSFMRFIGFGYEFHLAKKRKQQKQSEPTNDTEEKQIAKSNQDEEELTFDLIDMLSYCFYTPTSFGSIISYPHFYAQVSSVDATSGKLVTFSLKDFLLKLALVAAWALGILVTVEFVYFNYLDLDVSLLQKLNGFGAASLTWIRGQYFQAKYMVIYGIPVLGAYLDGGVRLLPLPIFISRVYLYSAMWKHFDTGLYDFIKRYMYVPLGGAQRPILASALVFAFIYAWHGLTSAITIWAVMNYLQIVFEHLVRKKLSPSLASLRDRISPSSWRRLKALACALSAQWSFVAIAFFLMGQQIGWFISKWTIVNLQINYFMYLVCTYTWVQTCFSYENWEAGFSL